MRLNRPQYDVGVIGAGFYGSAIALKLSLEGKRVVLIERESDIMQRASFANQARIHQGYHYPRSILSGIRSRKNFDRFVKEFKSCVYSKFDKYYAIGALASKTNAAQFKTFCERIEAPIERASNSVRDLFCPNMIEDVFKVREYAFDSEKLKDIMLDRLEQAKVEVIFDTEASRLEGCSGGIQISLNSESSSNEIWTQCVFNCTYSSLNRVINASNPPVTPLTHELTELALVEVPDQLSRVGVTVMDGPFFSIMPFPPRKLHSLSHVRYTPHHQWEDSPDKVCSNRTGLEIRRRPRSHYAHMLKDAARYMPLLNDCRYVDSLWETKTILPRSEATDSRPILFQTSKNLANVYSIMGGKIDNIFDIEEKIDSMFGQTSRIPSS